MQALGPDDPERVGRYRMLAVLGQGGMGRVQLGAAPDGRLVAVKQVHARFAHDDGFRARFRREVAASRRVSGAYTAAVIEADADAPSPWLASVFVAGPSLGAAVEAVGTLPEGLVRRLAAGLATALEEVHGAGLIHRDLKPDNVLLAEDGVRVIDFGIARAAEGEGSTGLTRTGWVIGSPAFMSPEQAESRELTAASDMFSLGSVLVMATTGRSPFAASSTLQTLYDVVHAEPDLSAVPPALRPVIARCMAKDPGARPTPAQLLELLGPVAPVGRQWPPAVYGLIAAQRAAIDRLLDAPSPDSPPQPGAPAAGSAPPAAGSGAPAGPVPGAGAEPSAASGHGAGAEPSAAPVHGAGTDPSAGPVAAPGPAPVSAPAPAPASVPAPAPGAAPASGPAPAPAPPSAPAPASAPGAVPAAAPEPGPALAPAPAPAPPHAPAPVAGADPGAVTASAAGVRDAPGRAPEPGPVPLPGPRPVTAPGNAPAPRTFAPRTPARRRMVLAAVGVLVAVGAGIGVSALWPDGDEPTSPRAVDGSGKPSGPAGGTPAPSGSPSSGGTARPEGDLGGTAKYWRVPSCTEMAGSLPPGRTTEEDDHDENPAEASTGCTWYAGDDMTRWVSWKLKRTGGGTGARSATEAQQQAFAAEAREGRRVTGLGFGDEAFWGWTEEAGSCRLVVRDGNLRVNVTLGAQGRPTVESCENEAKGMARSALAAVPH
ncbi:protein kinase [Streptomyces sp. NPDC089799]|uniref:serine/threonine-protein kinase n=1 Tax=Streptomyces sp. NPDC089799 TaxID=3155066 RepID=UPI00342C26C4